MNQDETDNQTTENIRETVKNYGETIKVYIKKIASLAEALKTAVTDLVMTRSSLAVAQSALKKEQEINGTLRQQLHEAEKQSEKDKETIRRLEFVIDQNKAGSTLLS